MDYRYVIANVSRTFLVGTVNYRAVLDIDHIADANVMNITSDDRIKPDTA
jgi:hypothetical protein